MRNFFPKFPELEDLLLAWVEGIMEGRDDNIPGNAEREG